MGSKKKKKKKNNKSKNSTNKNVTKSINEKVEKKNEIKDTKVNEEKELDKKKDEDKSMKDKDVPKEETSKQKVDVKKKVDNDKKKKDKEIKSDEKKNKIRLVIIIILTIIFIVCIAYLVLHFYNANKNEELYNEIQEEVDETTNEITKTEDAFAEKVKELQQEYSDVKGWIRIENTNINYPLLQTTDNNYYTNHNYKKEKSSYGSIFINSNSNIKDENSNVIIYGHDMKDNQMFTDLLKYSDKAYYDEHPTIKIATEEEENEYQIAYVFKSRVFYKDEKNVFRYYQQYNFENEKEYNNYINNCKRLQIYDTGVTANFGEQLVTLITCEYSQENGRMVVVAKRVTV